MPILGTLTILKYSGLLGCWTLWSGGQSSWLRIQRSGATRFFWEVVGLERGPLSLVSTTEELLERKSSGSGLEYRKYGRRDPSHWPSDNLYPQKLALTSPTSGDPSVGLVRSRTQTTEFVLFRWTLSIVPHCNQVDLYSRGSETLY
jgi:hypothetical protein